MLTTVNKHLGKEGEGVCIRNYNGLGPQRGDSGVCGATLVATSVAARNVVAQVVLANNHRIVAASGATVGHARDC